MFNQYPYTSTQTHPILLTFTYIATLSIRGCFINCEIKSETSGIIKIHLFHFFNVTRGVYRTVIHLKWSLTVKYSSHNFIFLINLNFNLLTTAMQKTRNKVLLPKIRNTFQIIFENLLSKYLSSIVYTSRFSHWEIRKLYLPYLLKYLPQCYYSNNFR